MNPLRRLAALPLALVLFWTMVVAPWTLARCEHACGETRWHALGAVCADGDDDCCACGHGHIRPDHQDAGDNPGNADTPAACAAFKADDASQPDLPPSLKTPPPVDFIPVYPVSFVAAVAHGEPLPAHQSNAPPDTPPKETHGRGALPLLS